MVWGLLKPGIGRKKIPEGRPRASDIKKRFRKINAPCNGGENNLDFG